MGDVGGVGGAGSGKFCFIGTCSTGTRVAGGGGGGGWLVPPCFSLMALLPGGIGRILPAPDAAALATIAVQAALCGSALVLAALVIRGLVREARR